MNYFNPYHLLRWMPGTRSCTPQNPRRMNLRMNGYLLKWDFIGYQYAQIYKSLSATSGFELEDQVTASEYTVDELEYHYKVVLLLNDGSFQFEQVHATNEYSLADGVEFDSITLGSSGNRTMRFNQDGSKLFYQSAAKVISAQYCKDNYVIGDLVNPTESYTITQGDTSIVSFCFSKTGTKLYALDNLNVIYQYTLSTAFRVSTATYDTVSLSLNAIDTTVDCIHLSEDGTRLYFCGQQNDSIYQMTVATPYTISSATDTVTFDASVYDIRALWVDPTCTRLFIFDTIGNNVLSAGMDAKDLSTLVISEDSLSIGHDLAGLTLWDDKLFGNNSTTIYQYAL